MKQCKYCKSEIDNKAKICPNCRKPQGSSVLRIIIGVFIGLLIIGILSKTISDSPEASNYLKKSDFSYEVTKQGPDSAKFAYYIEGVVTNNNSKDYSYVQIEFICYDKDGINLGTALDNTSTLLGNQKWKFKAMSLSDTMNIHHCDYHEITGW